MILDLIHIPLEILLKFALFFRGFKIGAEMSVVLLIQRAESARMRAERGMRNDVHIDGR